MTLLSGITKVSRQRQKENAELWQLNFVG